MTAAVSPSRSSRFSGSSAPVPATQALPRLGAWFDAGADGGPHVTLRLWSTRARRAEVAFYDVDANVRTPEMRGRLPLEPAGGGVFALRIPWNEPELVYSFVLDGDVVPDPYARELPYGVHGPARVRLSASEPTRHPPLEWPADPVIYELHVGTFTSEGTFLAAAAKLPSLVELGVTTVELLPIAAFAGTRGWGYDGVALFAPHAPYGSPEEVRAFIDAAHALGLTVLLDAVYNHFGPSGNYLARYSPSYFDPAEKNAWGDAPNFREPRLRALVLENARMWLLDYGFDGLRLDAVHAIVDKTPRHIVSEIAEIAAARTPRGRIFVEDERNEPRLVTKMGVSALWADDFHHAVRVTLTGEQDGYYAAYAPGTDTIARVIEKGWVYEGEVYPPTRSPRGAPATELPASAFVYCVSNHDQVGNRALGTRLSDEVPEDLYRAASALLLFLPMTPLLFMGQEWAASTPFLFFTDHEPELGALVSKGRREEFRHFSAFATEGARRSIPDPQAEATFLASKLKWEERLAGAHARTLAFYRSMLGFRASDPVMKERSRAKLAAWAVGKKALAVHRRGAGAQRVLVVNFGDDPIPVEDFAPRGPELPEAVLSALRPLVSTVETAVPLDRAEGGVVPERSAIVLG